MNLVMLFIVNLKNKLYKNLPKTATDVWNFWQNLPFLKAKLHEKFLEFSICQKKMANLPFLKAKMASAKFPQTRMVDTPFCNFSLNLPNPRFFVKTFLY